MKQQYIEADEMLMQNEESFNLKKWLFRMFRMWPWFLVSLLVCLFAAWLYLRYTNPIYKAVASVMVKDEKKGAEMMDNSMLKEIGLGGNNKLVENEIEILKSYDLMEAVVNKLQLFVSIKHIGRIRDVAVFGDNIPFAFEIINPDAVKKTLHWTVTDAGNTVLFQGGDYKQPISLKYNELYQTGNIHFRCVHSSLYGDSTLNNTAKNNTQYKVDVTPPDKTVLQYTDKLSVDAASKVATVINLQIKDLNRERATAILQSLINIYNQQGIEDKNRVSDNTIDFLNERLIAVSNELQGVENSVEKFKSENRVTDLSSDAQQYLTMSQQIDIQKAKSQTQLNIINALQKDLELNQDNPQLVPSTLGIEEPSLGQLIEKHNQLVLQKERLQQKSGPKNPMLIDLQDQIKEIRSRLLTNVTNLKKAYTISLNDVSGQDMLLSNRIRNVPLLEKKLVQITRNQNVQQQLYAFLLQKREEAAVTRASNIEDSRTIVKARGLGIVSPKRNMAWTLSVLLGLVFPVILITVKDFMNTKIGDVLEVEQHTNVPSLGLISHVKKLNSPVVINSQSRSAVAEQIRNIRTSISFTGKGQQVKTILVTSFQSGDGKSFVSLNLAAAYALLNKKTVILEFDLRKPHITKNLGIDAKEGISNILAGKSKLEDLLLEIPGYESNLYLLPAGYLPPNPAELISGSKMGCLIKVLKERFDHIIIDTPPFSLVTDAALLQQYADINLVVLRQDYTSKDVYAELKQVAHNPAIPTYLLLNDVGRRKRYQNGYGYSRYGYAKGYYHEE